MERGGRERKSIIMVRERGIKERIGGRRKILCLRVNMYLTVLL